MTRESISTENEEGKSNDDGDQDSDDKAEEEEPELDINIDDVAISNGVKAAKGGDQAAAEPNSKKQAVSNSVERVANEQKIDLNGLLSNDDKAADAAKDDAKDGGDNNN